MSTGNLIITYASVKAELARQGYPTSDTHNPEWLPVDAQSLLKWISDNQLNSPVAISLTLTMYGFAYTDQTPAFVVKTFGINPPYIPPDDYAVVINATPLSGELPLTVTFTLTETGGNGTSFFWEFNDGDGSTATTTEPTVTHTFNNQFFVTSYMTPTVAGIVRPPVASPVITCGHPV